MSDVYAKCNCHSAATDAVVMVSIMGRRHPSVEEAKPYSFTPSHEPVALTRWSPSFESFEDTFFVNVD
jgi:hypothetical protein